MRLTKENRKILLDKNDGFIMSTYHESCNSEESRKYSISDGKLHIRATGKTSWADSRYDDEWDASDEETHSFLYRYQDSLKK